MRLNHEIKAYCRDFGPVRRVLQEIGGTLVGEKEQVDYFFALPEDDRGQNRRLKLRIDDEGPRLIYYSDRYEPDARVVELQIVEVQDPALRELLEAALGVRAVVRKRREVWRKDNATFNLDRVKGVGTIFEVEVHAVGGQNDVAQLSRYRQLFGPHLGAEIEGSNQDLVEKA
jgi:predicted adenylyl cyclase CyaB